MHVALMTYWFTWRQRPHHFAAVARGMGNVVTVYSNRSVANLLANVGNSLVHRSHISSADSTRVRSNCLLPSPRFDRVPFATTLNAIQRRRLLDQFTSSEADVHVFAGVPSEALVRKPACLVYDCMDDWSDFPSLPQSVVENERRICQMADRIWVVSQAIYGKLAPEFGSKLEYVPNGVDYEHFAVVPSLRAAHPRPVLGYVGTLHSWFDAQLVAGVADSLPDWDVALVGPIVLSSEQRQMLDRPNISFLGRQPYELLPTILASFDVAMIPFVLSDLVKGTSPIKLYEYLAAGLPVVSTSMPEVLDLSEPGVVVCTDDPRVFRQSVLDLRDANTQRAIERRQAIARCHTWQARFEAALAGLGPVPSREPLCATNTIR